MKKEYCLRHYKFLDDVSELEGENCSSHSFQCINCQFLRWIKFNDDGTRGKIVRVVTCELCNKTASENDFIIYGGINSYGFGICRDCSMNNSAYKLRHEKNLEKLKRKKVAFYDSEGSQCLHG